MIKFSLLLLTVYVVYYAGNILYDLFLKKDATTKQEDSDIFSVSDFSQEPKAATMVSIDDVENLNMPQSFIQNEKLPKLSSEKEERLDLEELRQRFESEQDLDTILKNEPEKKKDSPKTKDNGWYQILNLSETMVQLVSNIDGHKVYHATL
jgi:hypothetical protein